ncbi:MAG: hypothetical protein ACE5G9_08020 [Nitrospinales bacterium]
MGSGRLDRPGKQGWLVQAVLTLCLLWLSAPAAAEFVSLPESGPTFVDDEEVGSSPRGIGIHVQNKLLRDVLQRIQNESGIHFQLQEKMLADSITANFVASDWTSAVRRMLRNFSRLEVWDEDGLSFVLLLKSEEYSTALNRNADWMIKVKRTGNKGKKTKHVIRGRKFEIFLSEKELLELIKEPSDVPIPDYFIKDLQYRKFLEQFGFESLEDVFDIHNTRTVRLEVIRQLQELKKQNESGK